MRTSLCVFVDHQFKAFRAVNVADKHPEGNFKGL